jgi:hypothetical protein
LKFEDASDAVEGVDDELTLLSVVFIEEINEDFEPAAAGGDVSLCERVSREQCAHEMNI